MRTARLSQHSTRIRNERCSQRAPQGAQGNAIASSRAWTEEAMVQNGPALAGRAFCDGERRGRQRTMLTKAAKACAHRSAGHHVSCRGVGCRSPLRRNPPRDGDGLHGLSGLWMADWPPSLEATARRRSHYDARGVDDARRRGARGSPRRSRGRRSRSQPSRRARGSIFIPGLRTVTRSLGPEPQVVLASMREQMMRLQSLVAGGPWPRD